MALNIRGAWIVALSLMAGAIAPVEARAGEALYKEHCARCHARAGTLAANLKGQSAEDKATRLDEFLKTHYAEDAEERAKIVAYLMGLSRR
ncbi:MAG: c-type cytochrome [Hyphomicrobiaceae bacterium]